MPEIDDMKAKTVAKLRSLKEKQGLSIPNIMNMLEEKGVYISEPTVRRVFADSVDPSSFKYRDTLVPISDALLDLYSDKSGSEDIAALKAMIHDKNRMIDMLVAKVEEQRNDFERRINHLLKQIERLEKNLDFRENVVEKKDEIISRLISKVLDDMDDIEQKE